MGTYSIKTGLGRQPEKIGVGRGRRLGGIGQVPITNLLINPGFEEGAKGWEFPSAQWEIFTLKEYPHLIRTGGASIKCHPPMEAYQRALQLVPAKPGEKWVAAAWARTEHSPTGYAIVELAWFNEGKAWLGRAEITSILRGGENLPWTQLWSEGVAPANTAYAAVTMLVDAFTGGGFYFFEDCALGLVGAPPSEAIDREIELLHQEKNALKAELERIAVALSTLKQTLAVTPTPEQAQVLTELKTEISFLQKRIIEVNGEIAQYKAALAQRGVVLGGLSGRGIRYGQRR